MSGSNNCPQHVLKGLPHVYFGLKVFELVLFFLLGLLDEFDWFLAHFLFVFFFLVEVVAIPYLFLQKLEVQDFQKNG